MPHLRVFTFSPDWGLPTTGPFALKLLSWLRLVGLPYEQVIENRPGKGPAGKNPWVEIDGETLADSQRIIERLGREHGFDLDSGLSESQRAEGHAWRRGFEEGFHQVLEWELFVHPAGRAYIAGLIRATAPPVVGQLVTRSMCRHFERQLHARGLGRFTPEEVARIGRADLDALAARLTDGPFLAGDDPGLADVAVFGQVAPIVRWPMRTPVADHAKSLSTVVEFVDRLQQRCFTRNAPTDPVVAVSAA